ncbi:5'-nucleotidase C-terminal domain-containing protein [Amphibacillus cookii]|uniref:5'-nucleotidase C-terminal domain-containing protein n=1 Tax=Amphibacillus cookii TaxID=767787 RepID=UPI00195772BB|nr:5'-nucleotidase C-terminal domain-containing protein [Amphibacillus cookii]MBM7539844.1 2',3'-cyclic-nucleotide 2'-phosphodiesterase (5'-nucleotidase family)/DNA/RNA endonuclease YhcR with UshA esterase domain [Amphibacillus cookii]
MEWEWVKDMQVKRLLEKGCALILIVVMLFGLFTFNMPVVSHAEEDELIELKVLHTNDIHARINDFGKMAAYIKAEREVASHSLYLDAGDIFSGNPVVDLQYGLPIVELLNHIDLQAMAIGNHEFDYGQEETVKRIEQANFPWLSANMVVGNDTLVDFPQPELYHIFDVDGLTVGVLSLTETPPSTAPVNVVGMHFEDPIETAKDYQYLVEQTDILIALTHIGYNVDRQLAEEVDFFDLIIGGHSHTTLNQPAVVNGTPIVQTGGNGENIGNVILSFNPSTGEVEAVEGFLQNVSALTEVDSEIQAMVDQYNEEMDELLSEEIGYTETGLNRSGSTDTSLGNFWTDAMRHHTGADVALTNNGGIRANIAVGPITVHDIYTIEPFANEMMTYEMTGAALKDVIQFSYERRQSIDLQSSGLHYTILTNNTGCYVDAELYIEDEPIDPDATYTVAVSDYIGTGGSGYDFQGAVLDALTGMMTDAMLTYAKYLTANDQMINYSANERIAIEVTDAPIEGEPIGSTEYGLSSVNNRDGDSGLGNLYTDAVRAETGADFALLNGSSVNGNIPAGVITDSQIEFLDQYSNRIEVVKTDLDRLKDVILTQSNYHGGVDIQVSGIHYQLIKEGNQFVDVSFTSPDGSPLDEAKEYIVAYNDYMHGSNFYNLGAETVVGEYPLVWQSIVDYIRSYDGPIDYQEGSRITIDQSEGDQEFITVAEAIANNQGIATVQGYIVGTMTGNFDGPFVNTNMMLADSPDERNMDHILPVQLPNNDIRADLNLVDHPDNLGKHIQITGDLANYFSVPGLRSPTSYRFVEEIEEPELDLISIAEARAASNGEQVKVEGIATTNSGSWGGAGFYLQDETAGIYVYQTELDIEAGDQIVLTGSKNVFNGEVQISDVKNLDIVGQTPTPDPIHLMPNQLSSANQGQLVQIEGATISNLNEVNQYGTFEFNATVNDQSVLVRVDNRTGLNYDDFHFEVGDQVIITGISSIYQDTIQLKPRGTEDIIAFKEDELAVDVEADVSVDQNRLVIEGDSIARLAEGGRLTIDLADFNLDRYRIELTAEQLADLVSKKATLSVVAQDIQLNIPMVNFTDNTTFALTIEKITGIDNRLSPVYQFTIEDGDELITSFEEGITLSFAVDTNEVDNQEDLKIFYLNDQENWELVGGEYEDGYVTAITDHFSVFTVWDQTAASTPNNDEEQIMTNDDQEQLIDDDSGSTPQLEDVSKDRVDVTHILPETATTTFNWLLLGFVLMMSGIVLIMLRSTKSVIID